MARIPAARQILGLAGWLLLCFSAAGIGAVASVNAAEFYGQLTRPDWAPPQWLFGPVWTALYALMAIAAWLVWRVHGFQRGRAALTLFIIQLAFNALWSWVFFVWRQGALAFFEVLLLWMLIAATANAIRKLNGLAAALLLPYLAWVTFAAALTFSTWRLNPQLL
jgi:tryptophan-rich sensory protein